MKITDTAISNDPNSAFTIAATGKAFRILSDGLYSDKIRAIIRELSCNARDSHVAAGNDQPWIMHLPTGDEPWFSVEDFGTGMSHDDVINIYSRYFASTKTASNDYVGQLGLGSKSPFSYTNSFTVNSRYDGRDNAYRMYFDDSDTPRVDHISSHPTTLTGLKVQFAVPNGHLRWHDKAVEVLRWFDSKPIITGAVINDADMLHETPIYQGSGWRIYNESYWSGQSLIALMGGVQYPLDISSIPDIDDDIRYLSWLPSVVDFSIGDLDVAASRESLSYDTRTCANIKARLGTMVGDIKQQLRDAISTSPTLWEAKRVLQAFMTGKQSHTMQRLVQVQDAQLDWQGHEIKDYTIPVDTNSLYGEADITIRMHHVGIKSTRKTDRSMLHCRHSTKIVFDDCKKGGYARARQWHIQNGCKDQVVVFPKGKVNWNQLADRIGNPPIIWASTLPAPVKQSRRAIAKLYQYRGRGSGKGAWTEISADSLPSGTKHYVEIKAWDVILGEQVLRGYGVDSTFDNLRRAGLITDGTTIYGLRRNDIRKLPAKGWASLHDAAKAKAAALLASKEVKTAFKSAGLWDKIQGSVPTQFLKLSAFHDQLALRMREANSELLRFLQVLDANRSIGNSGSVTHWKWASAFFDIPVTDDDGKLPDEVKDAQRIIGKYGMIKLIQWGYGSPGSDIIDDIARYANAVDVSHTFLMLSTDMDGTEH